ncbi:GNAT family N-acetyltransferase [Rhodobacterales bacterium HKCCE3408]|nr:GNAT family N-acetyltransferase [Rhodobacterales bacterium HKCCE3408]
MPEVEIGPADPSQPDVAEMVAAHLARSQALYAAEASHVLSTDALRAPSIKFFAARLDGQPVGIGALRDLGDGVGEIKSMFTRDEARGRGVGRAMLSYIVAIARSAGLQRLCLETGTDPDSVAARTLYTSMDFRECDPFGPYAAHPDSMFMALDLGTIDRPGPIRDLDGQAAP